MNKNEVLAIVGNREITKTDVNLILQNLNPQTAAQFRSEDGMKNLVSELVNQELFYLDAVDQGLDKEEKFIEEVEKAKSGILKQFALNKVLNSAKISESDIEDYYEANKSNFCEKESVKASHILVDTVEEATKIANEITGGISFAYAAEKYSKCPSKQHGGDLGYFSSGMMVPAFEEAAFKMEVDEISLPVKTQFGYHLIMVCDKKASSEKAFDEVKDQIEDQLMVDKGQEMYQKKVVELKGKYPIQINL